MPWPRVGPCEAGPPCPDGIEQDEWDAILERRAAKRAAIDLELERLRFDQVAAIDRAIGQLQPHVETSEMGNDLENAIAFLRQIQQALTAWACARAKLRQFRCPRGW